MDDYFLIDSLTSIAQNLHADAPLEDRLEELCRATVTLIGCDGSSVFLSEGRCYRAKAHHGQQAGSAAVLAAHELSLHQPLIARAAERRQSVVGARRADSILTEPEAQSSTDTPVILIAPMLAEGQRLLGFLTAEYAHPQAEPKAPLPHLLFALAKLAGTVVVAERRSTRARSAALARLGHVLLSSLDSTTLAGRLCQLTAEMLPCARSYAFLCEPGEAVFRPVSSFGERPERWNTLRPLRLPRDAAAALLNRLRQREVARVDEDALGPFDSALADEDGSDRLVVALRQDDDFFGLLLATRPLAEGAFPPEDEQFAREIGGLASLALGNARRVEEIERASQLKSELVATMSHELRTPLNVIMGYDDLLLEGAFGPLTVEQSDTLRRVGKAARELLDLVTTTLDLSRLQAGRLTLDLHEVRLAEMLADLNAETQLLQAKPGVSFVWHVEPDLPELYTDPFKLKVIVKNLIVNAVKFTASGSVMVDVCARGDGVQIAVIDTGVGIAPEALPIILEPFRQAPGTSAPGLGGVGLGLYITRRFTEMLGGTLSVDSEVGRGSIFRVWVPRQALVPDDAPVSLPDARHPAR